MYQKQIIKSIVKYKDTQIVNKITPKSSCVFQDEALHELFKTIRDLTLKYGECPDLQFLKEYFKLEKTSKVKEALKSLFCDKTIETTPNLLGLLDQQLIFYAKNEMLATLKDKQNEIKVANGSDMQRLANSLIDNVGSIVRVLDEDNETEGIMFHDPDTSDVNYVKDKLVREYELRASGANGYYKFDLGIPQIDNIIGGVHSVDFIGILGYVKNGKSFLARQITYNVLCQKKNVFFVSLEMSFESIQHSMLALHANNIQYWGFDNPKVKTEDIRSGTLSDKAKDFYINKVIDDFTTNPEMGTLYIKQPASEYTPQLFFSDVRQLKNNVMDIDLIVIDYPSLMKPSSGSRDRDSYNELFRELRGFSLANHIPIIFPIQSNRHGYEAALKDKDNLFAADAISDFNSIEREATNVFSVICTGEMREAGQIQIQHLLSRESALVPTLRLNADFETGVITALQSLSKEDCETMITEIEI